MCNVTETVPQSRSREKLIRDKVIQPHNGYKTFTWERDDVSFTFVRIYGRVEVEIVFASILGVSISKRQSKISAVSERCLRSDVRSADIYH